jgi:hypothetical protein
MFRWFLVSLYAGATLCPASFGFASDRPLPVVAASTDAPADSLPDSPGAQVSVTEKGLPLAIVKGQIPIWTSPLRTRIHDLKWLLPLGTAIALTLTTDTDAMRDVRRDRSFNKANVNASNALLGSEIAIPVGLYSVGLSRAIYMRVKPAS